VHVLNYDFVGISAFMRARRKIFCSKL